MNASGLRTRGALQKPRADRVSKTLWRMFFISLALCVLFGTVMAVTARAAGVTIDVQSDDTSGNIGAIEVIFIFAFLALLPSILLMTTSFTRIIIVLGFLRNAMGTAQSPPNMILVGLAFFLSLFIMAPTINEMKKVAYDPYEAGTMDTTEALAAAQVPLKKFMLKQTSVESLDMFLNLANEEAPEVKDPANPVELVELPLTVITPAFITSEISRAFMMGFFIYLPFLVIDLVVSSILMSMGMVMLPPAMISLPFKVLLFVMVDGWNLMMNTLVQSFATA